MKRKQSVSGSVERKRKREHKDEISTLLRKMETREQEDRKKKKRKIIIITFFLQDLGRN